MLSFSTDEFAAPRLEAALWAIAALGALGRALGGAPGTRIGWYVLAAATATFALDKVVDMLSVLHSVGRALAVRVDPEHQLRGPNAGYRDAALAALFVAGCLLLWWLLRKDRQLRRGKLWGFAGVVLVFGIVVVRLAPPLQPLVSDHVTKPIEALAWLCVVVGLCIGAGPRPAPRIEADGFL